MKTYRLGFLTIRGGAGIMAVLAVVGTLLIGFAPTLTTAHLLLTPDGVVRRFEAWQLLTWLFIPAPSPMAVIFGLLLVVGIGSQLEGHWGTPRLWRVILGVGVTSALLTAGLGFVLPSLGSLPFFGLQTVTLTMWVALGLIYRRSTLNFWSLPISGYAFAGIGLAFSVLNGLFSSFLLVIPELLAAGLTFLVVHQQFPSGTWTRFRSWQLERELKRRSAHLRSLDGGRGERGSDKYLQ